jgi:hypothetical protein
MNKFFVTRHPTSDQIVKMTATELGRAVFWHREALKALEREQVMRFNKPDWGRPDEQ